MITTISCRLICVFALLISKASLQVTVEGVIGGSVVLECFSDKLIIQDMDVRWRRNKLKVCDIIQGKCSADNQDPKYKNRIETFPEEYEKGNFSLKLNNLTHTDAGKFQCYIMHSSVLVTVQLLINESTEAKKKQTATEGGNERETNLMWLWILLPVLCVFLICTSVYIVFRCKKGGDKTSSGCLSCRVWRQLSSNTLSNTSEPANQEQTGLQTEA